MTLVDLWSWFKNKKTYMIKGKVKMFSCQLSLIVNITEQRILVKCEQEPRIFWKFSI